MSVWTRLPEGPDTEFGWVRDSDASTRTTTELVQLASGSRLGAVFKRMPYHADASADVTIPYASVPEFTFHCLHLLHRKPDGEADRSSAFLLGCGFGTDATPLFDTQKVLDDLLGDTSLVVPGSVNVCCGQEESLSAEYLDQRFLADGDRYRPHVSKGSFIGTVCVAYVSPRSRLGCNLSFNAVGCTRTMFGRRAVAVVPSHCKYRWRLLPAVMEDEQELDYDSAHATVLCFFVYCELFPPVLRTEAALSKLLQAVHFAHSGGIVGIPLMHSYTLSELAPSTRKLLEFDSRLVAWLKTVTGRDVELIPLMVAPGVPKLARTYTSPPPVHNHSGRGQHDRDGTTVLFHHAMYASVFESHHVMVVAAFRLPGNVSESK